MFPKENSPVKVSKMTGMMGPSLGPECYIGTHTCKRCIAFFHNESKGSTVKCCGGKTGELPCKELWRINRHTQLQSCIESHHRPTVVYRTMENFAYSSCCLAT